MVVITIPVVNGQYVFEPGFIPRYVYEAAEEEARRRKKRKRQRQIPRGRQPDEEIIEEEETTIISPLYIRQLQRIKKEEETPIEPEYLGKDEEEEELGFPDSTPRYTPKRKQRVIDQPTELPYEYHATRLADIETLRGIRPITEPPQPFGIQSRPIKNIIQVEAEAEEKAVGIVEGFETSYLPQAEQKAQEHYTFHMGIKAQQIGMTYNPKTGQWIGTPEQIQQLEAYHPVVEQQAIVVATSWYERQWEQEGVETEITEMYRSKFEEEGYVIVEQDGQYVVMKREDYEREVQRHIDEINYERYMVQTVKEHGLWGLGVVGSRFLVTTLAGGLADPEFYQQVAKKGIIGGYEHIKQWDLTGRELIREHGPLGGVYHIAASPLAVNVLYPFAMGFGISKAIITLGTLGTSATIGTIGKSVATKAAKTIPYILGGTYATTEGVRIGLAFTESPEKGITALGEYGL
jgi:hypothetical protein